MAPESELRFKHYSKILHLSNLLQLSSINFIFIVNSGCLVGKDNVAICFVYNEIIVATESELCVKHYSNILHLSNLLQLSSINFIFLVSLGSLAGKGNVPFMGVN